MTLEEYNLLDAGSAHCSSEQNERANECLRHTAHQIACREHTRLLYDDQSQRDNRQPVVPALHARPPRTLRMGRLPHLRQRTRRRPARRPTGRHAMLRLSHLLPRQGATPCHHRGRATGHPRSLYRKGIRRPKHRVRPL